MCTNTYSACYYRVIACKCCVLMDVRGNLSHFWGCIALWRVGTKLSGVVVVVVVVVFHGVGVTVSCCCATSPHIQVHANVSFQSPACPSRRSTWETATAFTLRRDRRGEMFLHGYGLFIQCFQAQDDKTFGSFVNMINRNSFTVHKWQYWWYFLTLLSRLTPALRSNTSPLTLF